MKTDTETGMKEDRKRSRTRMLRILVPILILLAAGILFFMKNQGETESDLDATEDFDLTAILAQGLPVMVDFGADSCLPCKEMAPILVELNRELRGKAVIRFVDVWKNPGAAQGLPLQVIPTQFFFNADGSPYVPADPEAAARKGFILYTRRDTGEHIYTAHQGGLDKEAILDILKEMGMT